MLHILCSLSLVFVGIRFDARARVRKICLNAISTSDTHSLRFEKKTCRFCQKLIRPRFGKTNNQRIHQTATTTVLNTHFRTEEVSMKHVEEKERETMSERER